MSFITVLYLFSKDSCGPCRIVDKFVKEVGDSRVDRIVKINLEDSLATEEALATSKKYSITATPVLVVVNHDDVVIEEHVGAVDITRNLRRILETRLGG